ncbi:hypothetical protein Pse7367_1417 [Thalassoporum mexicanum PCC 7367]|uniref:hypothetical protein n=1 Tax=Thalassoporum mexicanum TaxID=3457544 RepID=UPI00029FD297|nr:hypothetical protein [Pseudanabaena sp. PCC 7367]AFY69708.1 hypothetical protein Pse7367_1417 [Pseudanabaena sp. PCC 7367]
MSNPDDLEARFRKLEQEVYAAGRPKANEPIKRAEPGRKSNDNSTGAGSGFETGVTTAKSWMSDLVSWINDLTGVTKIVAIVVVGVVAFGLLSFVFRLVTAAISLAIMAAVIYILYKVFLEPEPKS